MVVPAAETTDSNPFNRLLDARFALASHPAQEEEEGLEVTVVTPVPPYAIASVSAFQVPVVITPTESMLNCKLLNVIAKSSVVPYGLRPRYKRSVESMLEAGLAVKT